MVKMCDYPNSLMIKCRWTNVLQAFVFQLYHNGTYLPYHSASKDSILTLFVEQRMEWLSKPGWVRKRKVIGVGRQQAPTKTSLPQIRATKFHMQTSLDSSLQLTVANTVTDHGGKAGRLELGALRTLYKCCPQLSRRTRQNLRPG